MVPRRHLAAWWNRDAETGKWQLRLALRTDDQKPEELAQSPVWEDAEAVLTLQRAQSAGGPVSQGAPFDLLHSKWPRLARCQLSSAEQAHTVCWNLTRTLSASGIFATTYQTLTRKAVACSIPSKASPAQLSSRCACRWSVSGVSRPCGFWPVSCLAAASELYLLQCPAPDVSLSGDVLLCGSDGMAFTAFSLYLRHSSKVLDDLLEEQTEQLREAAASGQPLIVPLEGSTGSDIHLLLQVRVTLQQVLEC